MDTAVVADVVTPIVERRRVDRIQPDCVDTERVRATVKIIEMRSDAVKVADAVAIRIGERARIDLIEDGALPPFERHRGAESGGEAARAHQVGKVARVEPFL